MLKVICSKCGSEVSNEFGVSLIFCTNCGASLSLEPAPTVKLQNPIARGKQKSWFAVILLTSLLTSVFLFAIFGAGWYLWARYADDNSARQTDAKPTPRLKLGSPLGTADISEVSYTVFRHEGLLYANGKNRTVTNRLTLRADGTAIKIDGEMNYENQQKTNEKVRTFRGSVSKEQFKELAKAFIENDFLNEENSAARITDSTDYRLKMVFEGNEKEVILSNTNRNTPEVDAILQALLSLVNQVEFTEIKTAP